jgi:hypothetical protein
VEPELLRVVSTEILRVGFFEMVSRGGEEKAKKKYTSAQHEPNKLTSGVSTI